MRVARTLLLGWLLAALGAAASFFPSERRGVSAPPPVPELARAVSVPEPAPAPVARVPGDSPFVVPKLDPPPVARAPDDPPFGPAEARSLFRMLYGPGSVSRPFSLHASMSCVDLRARVAVLGSH